MQPKLLDGEYIFCTLADSSLGDLGELNPLATFMEAEGLSLLLEKSEAQAAGIEFKSSFKGITLTVHSSLDAVGLTAAVAKVLTAHDIPANVVAAHFHDHVFVPSQQAELALQLLADLG